MTSLSSALAEASFSLLASVSALWFGVRLMEHTQVLASVFYVLALVFFVVALEDVIEMVGVFSDGGRKR